MIHYLCSDETRVGLKTQSGKVITAKGVKPKVAVQWGRENFWIYGAISPLSGEHFLHEYPKLNGECFQEFLDWLSQQLDEDWAILQVDQAPAHMSGAIRWPQNIIPLVQPAHSPELNPIERFWEFLKSKLQWENCKNLTQLQHKLTDVLKEITPEMIASLTSYDFILEALFSAAS